MLIRLLDIRFGPGFFQEIGTELVLPDDEARALIAAGRAVELSEMCAAPIAPAVITAAPVPSAKGVRKCQSITPAR